MARYCFPIRQQNTTLRGGERGELVRKHRNVLFGDIAALSEVLNYNEGAQALINFSAARNFLPPNSALQASDKKTLNGVGPAGQKKRLGRNFLLPAVGRKSLRKGFQ